MKYDTIVLGAGMVGVSAALQLQRHGKSVVLIDRRPAAEETSYGNAGIIQREGVMPYPFPRDLTTVISAFFNRRPEAHLHYSALPKLAPWLYKYWRNSTPERVMKTARAANPLIRECLNEHKRWIEEACVGHLARDTGYLQLYRDRAKLEAAEAEKSRTRDLFGVEFDRLDDAAVHEMEPHLRGSFAGGIHLTQPWSIANPSALGKAYAKLFTDAGGAFETGDADTLEAIAGGWQVQNVQGPVQAANVVIALGPWSKEVMARFGVNVPLAVKRGYHMHYGAEGNAGLSRPILDTDNGFALVSMEGGIRLTTGAEFGLVDAPPTPVQLDQAEGVARGLFPLEKRLDEKPWLGRRPCMPDMLPVIGAVPGHRGLWANFGHHHLGFTLGPISGRLLAEMMTGAPTFTDPAPYRIDRF